MNICKHRAPVLDSSLDAPQPLVAIKTGGF
jgi:hypothetical protein